MRTHKLLTWSLALIAFLLPTFCFAAQNAVIAKAQAAIREKPDANSEVLEERSIGENLRVSSFHKNGWYKVRTKLGEYGWIWQADITVLGKADEIEPTNVDLKTSPQDRTARSYGKNYFFRGIGFLNLLTSSEISRRLEKSPTFLYLTPGFFAEGSVRIEDWLRFATRIGYYTSSTSVNFGEDNYDVEHSGIPLLVGLDVDIFQVGLWEVATGFYGGLSLNNKLTVTASDYQIPNSFTVDGLAYAFLLNWSAKYLWSPRWAFVLEAGLYYSENRRGLITADFNGSAPFTSVDNTLTAPRIRHIGPIFGVGLQASF